MPFWGEWEWETFSPNVSKSEVSAKVRVSFLERNFIGKIRGKLINDSYETC